MFMRVLCISTHTSEKCGLAFSAEKWLLPSCQPKGYGKRARSAVLVAPRQAFRAENRPVDGLTITDLAMKTPFKMDSHGMKTWENLPGDSYLITGFDKVGQKFRLKAFSWGYASGINVWKGSKWLIRDGKRHLICRILN